MKILVIIVWNGGAIPLAKKITYAINIRSSTHTEMNVKKRAGNVVAISAGRLALHGQVKQYARVQPFVNSFQTSIPRGLRMQMEKAVAVSHQGYKLLAVVTTAMSHAI